MTRSQAHRRRRRGDRPPARRGRGRSVAGAARRRRRRRAEAVTISVSNLPPTTESGAREAFLAARRGVRGGHTRTSTSSPTSTSGTSPRSPPSWPAARCRPSSRSRSPTPRASIERGQVADITAEVDALPYAADFNPNVLAVAQDADGSDLRRPDRRLRHRPALQPGAVRGGRPRSRRAADDVGRGARVRQGDRRRHRPGRLRPDDPEQHRRLDAHRAELRLRRPPAGRAPATASTSRSTTRARSQALEYLQALRWEDNSMGVQLPARLGHDQPGVRRRPGRHVHERVRRLQQPRHRERASTRTPTG